MSPREEAAKIDPEYFRADRKQTRRFWGSVALAIVAIAAATYAVVGTRELQTACNKDPGSRECAEVRLDVARAEPLRNPCASFQRVTSRRGRNCERFYVKPAPEAKADSRGVQQTGGDPAGEAPVQSDSDSAPAPAEPAVNGSPSPAKSHGPRHDSSPAPPPPVTSAGPAPATAAPTSSAPTEGAPESPGRSEEATSRGTLPQALESVGQTAGNVVDKAEETVKQTGCAVRELLKPCP